MDSKDLNSIFKLNENLSVGIDYIETGNEDSKFFIIDDFFKNPDEIIKYLSTLTPEVYKNEHRPSFNTIYFDDLRHYLEGIDSFIPIYELLSNLCGYEPERYDYAVTNLFRFRPHLFNNFYRNYWSPHIDFGGYIGIVYLNKNDDYNGTNIYRCLDPNFITQEPEHYKPWHSKENFELILTVPPKYNRLFFFNGSKYNHGMNIYNQRYSGDEYRTNIVFHMNTPNFPCE